MYVHTTDGQTDKQTDCQVDGQTDRHMGKKQKKTDLSWLLEKNSGSINNNTFELWSVILLVQGKLTNSKTISSIILGKLLVR